MRVVRGLTFLLTSLGAGLCLLGLTSVGASSANISHSFHTSKAIPDGSIVSLEANRNDYVEAANTSNGKRLVGVTVASNDSLLAVDAGPGLTQVATSGNANTLVSTLNGSIKVGDTISVSPFSGVGMKGTSEDSIIGLAQTALDKDSSDLTTKQVTDKDGHSSDIKVGFIRLTITPGLDRTAPAGGPETNSLQKLGKSLTGHTISTPRLILSLVIAVVALGALLVLIYASIYGSIISIGRNPLAKYAVFRAMGSVLGMAALTALIAAVIIYFLLR